MRDEDKAKAEQAERARALLRDTFGAALDEEAIDKIAEKAAHPKPVLVQRKPLPR